jgi:hypothetical protein
MRNTQNKELSARHITTLRAQLIGLVKGGADLSRIERKEKELLRALDNHKDLINSLSKLK